MLRGAHVLTTASSPPTVGLPHCVRFHQRCSSSSKVTVTVPLFFNPPLALSSSQPRIFFTCHFLYFFHTLDNTLCCQRKCTAYSMEPIVCCNIRNGRYCTHNTFSTVYSRVCFSLQLPRARLRYVRAWTTGVHDSKVHYGTQHTAHSIIAASRPVSSNALWIDMSPILCLVFQRAEDAVQTTTKAIVTSTVLSLHMALEG